jgi:hypothetical protein
MFVVEEYRGSRHRLELCRRCSPGRTTDRARFRPDTAFLKARTERAVHRPFGPSNIPHSTSSVSLSSRGMSCREPTVALLLGLWGLGKVNTTDGGVISDASSAIKLARSFGRFPPNMRAMLKSDRLPQTRHVSFGLSLTTSHSAHSTAFCNATALRTRPRSGALSTTEPFITEPPQELTQFYEFTVRWLVCSSTPGVRVHPAPLSHRTAPFHPPQRQCSVAR